MRGPASCLSRTKHSLTQLQTDVADLVAHALDTLGASVDDVELVVQNNHHYRIAPYEARLPFSQGVGYSPASHRAGLNLLPGNPNPPSYSMSRSCECDELQIFSKSSLAS